ncbi:spore coat associated protein CotJA [Qiania dongpingensis]|uniref:Spore coat associated protein CotJA n=1 Tax=Qiania dongpingensis TaxID=2763669 RepID=A0A7G9G2R4_9FIRM|nr:spore coat associated protein CotJA [Qiania dongpingensis]QNM05096.1 spore coat associated protein CotJA [Qiania dongpingensis]
MAFVPWQQWECTYPLDQALFIGTVFPSLDKPFVIGRCAVRP